MKIRYILILLAIVSMSCTKWLDITPTDNITSDKLFEKGNGYRVALYGIYKTMSEPAMYGKEMMWASVECLGQMYLLGSRGIPTTDVYGKMSAYDFKDSGVEAKMAAMWERAFFVILNCNSLISNIEKTSNEDFANGEIERNLILGEAMAVRAIIHLDMLRLFAPSPAKNNTSSWIPYYDKFPATFEPNQTTDKIKELILKDLNRAVELIGAHDNEHRNKVKSYKLINADNLFFEYRSYRINIGAVYAYLARVHNYFNEHQLAYDWAKKVIEYRLNDEDMQSSRIYSFSTSVNSYRGSKKGESDLIFSLSYPKVIDTYSTFDGTSTYQAKPIIRDDYNTAFDDGGDWRKSQYLVSYNGADYRSNKYIYPSTPDGNTNSYIDIIPMIRLSEMWYIVAEAAVYGNINVNIKDNTGVKDVVGTGIELSKIALDKVRIGRGCNPNGLTNKITDINSFTEELLKDVRREFLGEGQSFFFFKKLDRKKIADTDIEDNNYVVPKPNSELIF